MKTKVKKSWFNNINWQDECLQCREKNNGNCPDPECAAMNYDKNGNKIPPWVFHADGNTLEEYLKSLE